ncbi:uncharacterized protein LOC114394454 [Glycine soja]|uniref:Uncharacterized protein n=1 Tax=Glycine soja TaxID=3848 RepID=A0A0B2SG15_GLYSO|nr:uncharacterized protein LOC114394454 [Glycine soja]KHN43985.1 hypothetical protein glysoja_048219 [Glycine soja]
MRRSLVFQQQYYADDGMWMETQAQQHGYAFHEESSWSSDKRFPAMHMNNLAAFAVDSDLSTSKQHAKLGAMHMNKLGAFGTDFHILMSKQHVKFGGSSGNMFQQGMHSDHGYGRGYAHHGSGKRSPFGANKASHHFSKGGGGGGKFNSGEHHEYFSEETEYEEAYAEEHVGAITAKVEEMRYQHHNWAGDTCYVNPYDRNKNW